MVRIITFRIGDVLNSPKGCPGPNVARTVPGELLGRYIQYLEESYEEISYPYSYDAPNIGKGVAFLHANNRLSAQWVLR